MDPNFISALVGAASGAITGTMKAPLKSIDDLWFATIGYKTDLMKQKAIENNKLQLGQYAEDIANEIKQIPEVSIKEPDYTIAGPALEASTYFVNNDETRMMFAKLIASSVDKRESSKTRSAFVEFIKQMTPFDAKLLNIISDNKDIALAQISYKFSPPYEGYKISNTEVMPLIDGIILDERATLPSAFINLRRLGLISFDYDEYLVDTDYEKIFSQTPEYKEVEDDIKDSQNKFKQLKDLQKNPIPKNKKAIDDLAYGLPILDKFANSKIGLKKGKCYLTSLGEDFVSVCL